MMSDSELTAVHRLASYGTLAPGRANYHQLEGIAGEWKTGMVKGRLVKAGWGVHLGFPGIILDEEGDDVEVHIFESGMLPDHWERLDAFEGEAYNRVVTKARTNDGDLEVCIYEVIPE